MPEPTVMGLHSWGSQLRRAKLRRVGSGARIVALERDSLPGPEAPPAGPGPASAPGEQAETASGSTSGQTHSPATTNATVNIASMPAPDVMTRCWAFPQADDVRFRHMVAHRLEADLPVPIDQLIWGYRRARPASSREPTTHVLAQAACNDRVGRYLISLSTAGFHVDALTTEAEALTALCRYGLEVGPMSSTEVLVLATADEWLVAGLRGGMVCSVRRVHVNPMQLELACQDCRQCIEADQPVHDLQRVLWCASSEMADARHALAEKIGVPVEPAAPARDLVQAGGERTRIDQLVRFGPAIGLALAGLFERDDLICLAGAKEEALTPRWQRLERILARPWRWTAVAGVGLILAAAIHVGAVAWETRTMSRLLDGYDQANSAMAALEPKIRAMQRLQTYRIDVEGIIADVCAPIPESMVISSIQLSRERGLVIKGTASDPKTIFALAEALREEDRFAQVRPGRTEPGKGGGFTITADLAGVEKLSSLGGRGGLWR